MGWLAHEEKQMFREMHQDSRCADDKCQPSRYRTYKEQSFNISLPLVTHVCSGFEAIKETL